MGISVPNGFLNMSLLTPQLIEQCNNGDRKAQSMLYHNLSGILMGICRRYYKNREDCVMHTNTAFMKILRSLKSYKNEGPFEAWCVRIMMNSIIDDFRAEKKRREMISDQGLENVDMDQNTFVQADSVLSAEDLEQLLHKLPEMTKCVFNLFAIDGYSHAEIGSQLNMSEGTSRWHVSEARRMLKGWLMEILPQKGFYNQP